MRDLLRRLKPHIGLLKWGIALGIINLVWGAVVMGERKVIWAGWLTMGKLWEEPYTEFEGIFASFRPYSDTVFMATSPFGIHSLANT